MDAGRVGGVTVGASIGVLLDQSSLSLIGSTLTAGKGGDGGDGGLDGLVASRH